VRVGRHIELQFTGAELIQLWGSEEEPYGDGTITLTPEAALRLAKKVARRGAGDSGGAFITPLPPPPGAGAHLSFFLFIF